MSTSNYLTLLVGCLVLAVAAAGERSQLEICFQLVDHEEICVGTIALTRDDTASRYEIQFDESRFGSHFLSMRPFKCLDGPESRLWCHLPYPYELERRIDPGDLLDLEYDLLFVVKGPKEFGINLWHGRYFRLQWSDGDIVGELHEVDLNILAVPPEPGNLRPITSADLHQTDAANHWLPTITMRKQ